jgi:hypothetical protein
MEYCKLEALPVSIKELSHEYVRRYDGVLLRFISWVLDIY